jgi:hypothetical protein
MRKLTTADGQTITNQADIRKEQVSFYKELYSSRNTDLNSEGAQKFLGNNSIPKLTEDEKTSLEGLLTEDECLSTLGTFKINKSPGNDGLTTEFYRQFWPQVGKYLVEGLNCSYACGEMSTSQRQAIITLIDKKGKDRSQLKNWRPISLLNVDYKIATKTIARRMQTVLPSIIHHSQAGFVDGRLIGESVRTVADILEFTKIKNISGILLCIDFEKAFDSIEWNYLQKTLEVFNFGPSLRKWIETFYKNVSSCIANNGHTSCYFELERGVRQGDPLSPYLFIIGLELLAIKVRHSTDIRGINVDGHEIKLSLFADDISSFLADVASGEKLLDVLSSFEMCAGLKVNNDKTEAMWLGSARGSNQKPLGIRWPGGPIKVLGVYFSYNVNQCESCNFDDKVKSFGNLLKVWRLRNLTISGKITIVKTLGFSKLLYLGSVINVPKWVTQKVNKLAFNFIWNNHPDKVKRTVLINTYEKGGQQMMDLETMLKALQVSWIRQYLSPEELQWKHVLTWLLKPYGGATLLMCNCLKLAERLKLPELYKEAVKVWAQISNQCDNPRHTLVWNNDMVKIGGTPVFWEDFARCNFNFVADFFNLEGNLLTFQDATDKGITPNLFLRWHGLLSAFPRNWKHGIEEQIRNGNNCKCLCPNEKEAAYTYKDKYYKLVKSKNCQIYQVLLECKATENDHSLFNEEYDIEPNEWKCLYMLPKRVLIDARSREFQYKFLQNYISTNVKLQKMNIVQSNLCSLCGAQPETVKHLFFECVNVHQFWDLFKTRWHDIEGEIIVLTTRIIVFGQNGRNPTPLLNHLLILAKQYIYWCRWKKKQLSFDEFWNRVLYVANIEQRLSKSDKQKHSFEIKWNTVINTQDHIS